MSTIKKVAGLAGVSIGTVSHVLSGSVPVSDRLRRKVLAAIRDLDYHPNHIARSLKTNKSLTIGIVVPDMTIPFFPHVIQGAEEAARASGYSILAVNSGDNSARQQEVLSLLRSQRVEGILLVVAPGPASIAQIPRILESGIPLVCLDRVPGGIEIDTVCVEDRQAAAMGVSHLTSLGHRRIAILTGPLTLKNEQERLNGYKAALEEAGLPVENSLIWESTFNLDEVTSLCCQHLSGRSDSGANARPTALFATNGVTALGALRGLRACNMTTPEDIAFATFDELTVEDIFRPSITSVVQPAHAIGHKATEILLQRIEARSNSGPRIEVRLPAQLKIRESSGAQRTGAAGLTIP
ncbi:MAG TPA: LacI family DNA-binding transcriptional regulator [Bryobacteraceae bacterium]|nr:LacI family DNA-binding transcriptional regulator [Bryobacteraceae bacterium]